LVLNGAVDGNSMTGNYLFTLKACSQKYELAGKFTFTRTPA